MNRCWALFLSLCCYLRLVSAEVSCDGGGGAGSLHSSPPPRPHPRPPSPLPAVNFGPLQPKCLAPGAR